MKYIFKNKYYCFLIGIIDIIGIVLTLPFRIFKRRDPGKRIDRILLIRLDHIGDVASCVSIPQNLKRNYPLAKIVFLVSSLARDLLKNNPCVDEIICFDAPWFNQNNKGLFGLRKFLKLASELRKYRFDLGIDLRGDFRHILLMFLAGVKFRVGYGITGGGFLLNRQVKYREGAHAIEHNLDLLRGIGLTIDIGAPQLYVSQEDELTAENLLKENNLCKDDFIIALHPYAGYSSKNWLDNRLTQLLNRLHSEYHSKIVLIGALKDKERNSRILQSCNIPAINLSGRTSLGTLSALLKKINLFIGVDSGPSHIAALAGLPTIILYSGTNRPEEWAPRNNNVFIVRKDTQCQGCERLECGNNVCMELITVDDVMSTVRQAIKR